MEKLIKQFYPEAEEGRKLTKTCMDRLQNEHGFEKEKTILGTSVCSDEIVRSATNFRDYLGVKNPFQLGGLAGFPFSGLTGFGAFASHIPDKGYAIIQFGPHIGFSKSDGIGRVNRIGRDAESSCCGALQATVQAFSSNQSEKNDPELDYQQWKIGEELGTEKSDITKNNNPLIKATDVMYGRIQSRIHRLLEKSSDNFKNTTVALVGGIIINTDFDLPDWFELREFTVHTF